MNAPTYRSVQLAVVAWHNRHPLAAHIDSSQVHNVGWVALPFMRAAQGIEPTLAPTSLSEIPSTTQSVVNAPKGWRRWRFWQLNHLGPMRGTGPWGVFSEVFIDGLSNARAAAFARQHGLTHLPTANAQDGEWPQRRVELDSALAERAVGAWPMELWVASAAIDLHGRRYRVLVSPDGKAVVGRRHWNGLRAQLLGGVAVVILLAGGAVWWRSSPSGAKDITPASPQASGVVAPATPAQPPQGVSEPASVAASAAPALAAPTPAPALASSQPASAAEPAASSAARTQAASTSEASTLASAASTAPPDATPSASAPLFDIRPRLRPPGAAARAPTLAPSAPARSPQRENTPSPARATLPQDRPAQGAASPENLRAAAPASGPLVALVSPGMANKADAQAMLKRMREHLSSTMGKGDGLQGEVLESPEGWRAAVWPFASREEAQILNATMVARGWKTRAMNF